MNTIPSLIATISIGILCTSSYSQDENVLIKLDNPAYGVRIKTNWPNYTGGWARGFYITNEDNSEMFFSFGAAGGVSNGDSTYSRGWIGRDYNDTFMTFLPNGSVGIGIDSPVHKLDVNGNIRAKGDNARLLLGSSNGTTGQIHFLGRAQQNNFHASGSTAGDFVIAAQGGENIHLGTNSTTNAIPISRLAILSNGNIGIGTVNPTKKLSVNGTIQAKEVIVETGWSDFVFDDSYHLRSLDEVESHIEEYGHLPDVPSAAIVESEGLSVGEAQKIMMQKIEELTLYMIEKDKQVAFLQAELQAQKEEIQRLKSN